MDGKIVALTTPVESFGKKVTEVVLREPKGSLFARLGPPRIVVANQSVGSAYFVEQNDVIAAYLEALLDGPTEDRATILGQISLLDMMRMREGLFEFFQAAEAKLAATRRNTSVSA